MKKITVSILVVTTFLFADLSEIDRSFLSQSDSIVNSSISRSIVGMDTKLYDETSIEIKEEIYKRLQDELENNRFDSNIYNSIVNSVFNEKLSKIDDLMVKYKLNRARSTIINSFNCTCSSALSSAFKKINKHLLDESLYPLEDNLKEYLKKIKETNSEIELHNKSLKKELERMKLLVLKTKEYLYNIKQKNAIKRVER